MSDEHQSLTPPPSQALLESMTALRRAAGQAKSLAEWRRTGRYATEEEIELSETLRRPTACAGHSARTGLACALPRVHGMTCCRRHGGNLKKVKAKAAQRLREITMPVIESMYQATQQTGNLGAAVKAGTDLLDRANVGALVRSKVRTSKKDRNGQGRIIVSIGFLSAPGDKVEPTTIIVAEKNESEKA